MQKNKFLDGKIKRKYLKKCNDCHQWRKSINESHQICKVCYKAKTIDNLSGNKFVDDFIRYTQVNHYKQFGIMEFVSHDQFENVEFIAEGGSSKIYKATWTNGFIRYWDKKQLKFNRNGPTTIALKQLKNSKNITSKELNEVNFAFACM